MKTRIWIPVITAASVLIACNAQQEPSRRDAASASPVTQPEVSASSARVAPGTAGQVRFTVDGTPKDFGFIAAEHTSYNRLASKIQAQPSPDSRESATIIFSNVDLKELGYPIELPLPRDLRDPSKPMMAMIMIGFAYIDQDGTEWAGPGRVRIDSFLPDGTISGTFTDISLPHTEKELPNVVLSNGRFTAALWSP